MVQIFVDPTLSPNGTPIHETPDAWRSTNTTNTASATTVATAPEGKMMSREEHAQRVKELEASTRQLNMRKGLVRPPRRGWSLTDYQVDNTMPHAFHSDPASHFDRQVSIPENTVLANSDIPTPAVSAGTPNAVNNATPVEQAQLLRRPKMPPPRRSQSVTDKEPLPLNQPQASVRLGLLDLPSELHYSMLDFLDPIDSVCLGLAHSRLYTIHRRKHGKVALSSRLTGPNDRELRWTKSARPELKSEDGQTELYQLSLEQLRQKGQLFCRKCGNSRCELHRHLKSWIGDGYEYCEVKDMFVTPADEHAKSYCFMPSPKNRTRCARHGAKKVLAQ